MIDRCPWAPIGWPRPGGLGKRGVGGSRQDRRRLGWGGQAPRKLGRCGLALIGLALITACGRTPELDLGLTPGASPPAPPTAVQPTLGPPPPDTLIVCLGQEPESLYRFSSEYLYGPTSREAETVLQAVYDGPIDVTGYTYQPVILEDLPSLEGGGARLTEVTVRETEIYFNPRTLQPESLSAGKPYLPSGCQDSSCIQTYGGGEVGMQRMEVDFQLREGIVWSDGQPLTAQDSVYAFDLDRHRDTPTPKTLVDRTWSYQAFDERTVRWIGIPGYMDSEYSANFWSPLPQHVLGQYAPLDLLSAPESVREPLGWGAYQLEDWLPGQQISLIPNPLYFRAAEGLPSFDRLIFRFIASEAQSSIDQLLTGECDVLDESAILQALGVDSLDVPGLTRLVELRDAGSLALSWSPGSEMERLDFNLDPSSDSPALFADVRTRKAVAACLDREALVRDLLHQLSVLPQGYLPPGHPLQAAELEQPGADLAEAQRLLGEAGWVDEDGSAATPRQAAGVAGVPDGTPLQFGLLIAPGDLHLAVGERIQRDLARCGMTVDLEVLSREQLFEGWPDGRVFGRGFQTVAWAWPSWVSPLCEMFAGFEVAGPDRPLGVNATGFSDPLYDAACSRLLLGPPSGAAFAAAAEQTQQVFIDQLPAIPLYMRPRLLAHSTDLCGVQIEPSSLSPLWNIERFTRQADC